MTERRTEDPRTAAPRPPFPAQSQPHPGEERGMRPQPDHGEATYRGAGRLRDRVALITGADSGIGRAVAIAFAREGADVAAAYLEEHADAAETRHAVEAAGRRALTIPGDLSDEDHRRGLVERTIEQFGRVDILVNNAAFQGKSVERFEDLTAERIARTFQINILAMFSLVRLALPHMGPGGAIVNTASIQAYQPSPSILDYAATKGAIVSFTKGLARALLPRGIRVNAVAPGPVWTPLIVQSYEAPRTSRFGEQSPMGRPAQPAELAPAYVFLASDEARYVNGEILGVTGGELLA